MTYLPVDVIIDNKTKQKHRLGTLNLLAYVVLLVLVLITTWFFKRRKRLHIHETGLAIIYGLIMGAALRYFGLEATVSTERLKEIIPQTVPADYVTIQARNLGDKNANQTHVYAYEFRGEISLDSHVEKSQISYATVDPEVFFNIILPPIVLNAGLSLKRRHFFHNIGAIFSYAIIGTTISVAFVGSFIYGAIHLLKSQLGSSYLADQFSLANCLYFGAIISPTDPIAVLAIFQELGVDVNLFALVFGESILNDAVSIVLTHSIDQFSMVYGHEPLHKIVLECFINFINMFSGSCLIGMAFGIVSALTTKFTKLTESPLLETSLVVLMSYSSFLTAEVIDASGIVAILFCGITQAHYTINNLSFEARDRLKTLFELMTFLCENYLFLAVGVCFWQKDQIWDPSFIGIAFVAIFIARALSVYPLTVLLNLGRRTKIPCNFQHLIAWGGAARGVISYSLASKNTVGDARRIMLSTTSVIVIVTVISVGSVIGWLLKRLRIPYGPQLGDKLLDEDQHQTGLMATNNPGWLVRPKRLTRSLNNSLEGPPTNSSIQTPCHRANCTAACKQARSGFASLETTPVLEIESVHRHNNHHHHHHHPHHHYQSRLPANNETETNNAQLEEAKHGGGQHESSDCALTKDAERQQLDDLPEESSIGGDQSATSSLATLNQNKNSSDEHMLSNTSRYYENATLVRCWRNMDNNFIKPLLTNSHPSLVETMPSSLGAFARFFTSDEQLMRQH